MTVDYKFNLHVQKGAWLEVLFFIKLLYLASASLPLGGRVREHWYSV